jgi:glycosyltransferase involved in cell wall biosynthesis
MPSTQEGFGLVYLEAMNYAKPCVGCRAAGAADVIVDGETGFLVEGPIDRREMLTVLRRLLADPVRAQAMGRRGLERLHRSFTAHHYQQRVKAAIAGVLQ